MSINKLEDICLIGRLISACWHERFGNFIDHTLMKTGSFKIVFQKGEFTYNEFNNIIHEITLSDTFGAQILKDKLLNLSNENKIYNITDNDIDILDKIKNAINEKFERNLSNFDTKKITVYGHVQSGKTKFELSMIWLSKFIHKRLPILLLSNSLNSYKQVVERDIKEFNMWIDEITNNQGKKFYLKIGILNCKTSLIEFSKNNILMAIGNATQLTKLLRFVDKEKPQYDLVVDEADIFIKDINEIQDSSKAGIIYDKLVSSAQNIYEVTATTFAVLNKIGNNSIKIFLKKNPLYRGLDRMNFCPINVNVRGTENIDNLVKVTKECISNSLPNPDGYTSILVNASSDNTLQKIQAKAIKKAFPDQTVYVINTDGKYPSIKEIDDKHNYIATAFYSIHELYNEKTRTKINNIIVSGFMAGRANSFRPLKGEGCGGLSGMIYVPTEKQHCAASIQCMRIFGNYAEDYPEITLYTTQEAYNKVKDEIANLDRWSSESYIPEETRKILEKEESLVVKAKHDRKNIDDTCNIKKKLLSKTDFSNYKTAFAEVQKWYPGLYTEHLCLSTRSILNYSNKIPKMKYGKNLERKFQEDVKKNMFPESSNQVAWYEERYEILHDIETHYKDGSNYKSIHTTGDLMNLDNIPYIKWREEDKIFNFNTCDKNTMYWIYTTKGTVRIYLPDNNKTTLCKIVHKS